MTFLEALSVAQGYSFPVYSVLLLSLLVWLLIVRGHWRSDWSRRRIRRAFREIDALDKREAPQPEYAAPLSELLPGLPPWAASYAFDRLLNPDGPSRRHHLEILAQSDFSPFRERLVDLARDSTDPLAAEIWEVLTGRHRSQWSRRLVETDGKAGFADPPPFQSGAWCGYYIQLGAEHRMDLTLTFEKESFQGEGSDIVGPFSISGRIQAGYEVAATKRYATHAVAYHGRVDGDGFAGQWSLFAGGGGFRFWPRRKPVDPPAVSKGFP